MRLDQRLCGKTALYVEEKAGVRSSVLKAWISNCTRELAKEDNDGPELGNEGRNLNEK